MKNLSREFTLAEKLLLALLCLALAGLAVYQFVYIPIGRELEGARIYRDELETQVSVLQSRLAQLKRMEEELERVESSEHVSRMPSYNSSKEEIALLNGLWEESERYSVSFAPVTRSGDLIRRGFSLQFTTWSFERAKRIVSRLTGSEYRCLLSSLRYAVNANAESAGRVIVTIEGTFYETMVGGTPDIALPS